MERDAAPLPPLQQRHAVRVTAPDHTAVDEDCWVVAECPLTITIDGGGDYTLMCTPTQTAALAVGFAFSEGLIESLRDIDLLYHCEDDPGAVRLRLRDGLTAAAPRRNMVVASSCGLCGCVDIDAVLAGLPRSGDTLTVSAPLLHGLQHELRNRQQLFTRTGGTHAAALFTAAGEVIAFAEDLGRHNALDKCLGQCLLADRPTVGLGVFLSGRVSLEMITKSARAGLELVAAVSAPSTLAIDAAARANITLAAFLRDDRVTLFTHPARLGE